MNPVVKFHNDVHDYVARKINGSKELVVVFKDGTTSTIPMLGHEFNLAKEMKVNPSLKGKQVSMAMESEEPVLLIKLGEDVYDRERREEANRELHKELNTHPRLKESVIDAIADYALTRHAAFYNYNLPENIRDQHFLGIIEQFLSSDQIVKLAHVCTSTVKETRQKGRTR